MDTDALESLGLTRNESIVYLTLLEQGRAQIGDVAEKTRMHRRTIYDCLERLKDRGLVNFVSEGKTRFFAAVHPQRLRAMLKEKESRIEDLFPRLLKLSARAQGSCEVGVFKGKEGLKTIMDDLVMNRPKVWQSLTSAGLATKIMPNYIAKLHRRRIKERIRLEIIFGKNKESLTRAKELSQMPYTHVRLIDTRYVIPISLWLYNDKIAFMLWDQEIGILIENKETAGTFKNYFKVLFGMSMGK